MPKTAYRTHTCGELRADDAGRTVALAGWVHRRRDQGGLVFLDLRDRYGLTQVSVSREDDSAAHDAASSVKSEYTVRVHGVVQLRPDEARNDKLATGAVEVVADRIDVLSTSPTPPIEIAGGDEISEEVRLKTPAARPSARGQPGPHLAAARDEPRDPGVFRSPFVRRDRDADSRQSDAGRRARLSRPQSFTPGTFLRAAAGAADLQADLDVFGVRPLLPDRAVFP